MKAYLLLVSTLWLLLTSSTQIEVKNEVLLKQYIFEDIPAISKAMSVVRDSIKNHTNCSEPILYSLNIHSFHYNDISFLINPDHHIIQKKRCYDLHNTIILTLGEETFITTELDVVMLLTNQQRLIKTSDYKYSLNYTSGDSCLMHNSYDFYLLVSSNDSAFEFDYTIVKNPVWGRMIEIE